MSTTFRFPDEVQAQIDTAIFSGNPIAAIKIARNGSGCTLKEALEYVNDVRRPYLRSTSPGLSQHDELPQATPAANLPRPIVDDEARHWKAVAVYLATCHAATLASLPKGAAKSQRARLAGICRESAKYLRGTQGVPWSKGDWDRQVVATIDRCNQAVERYCA